MTACHWQYDRDDEAWDTACGHRFQTGDGTPTENDMAFCCFCGKPLVEVVVKRKYHGPGYLETTGYLPEGSAEERETKS